MLSKFTLAVLTVVFISTLVAFPLTNKSLEDDELSMKKYFGDAYSETCDKYISMCGEALDKFVENICSPEYFVCTSNITVSRSSQPSDKKVKDWCCGTTLCTPRLLRMFFTCKEIIYPEEEWDFTDILGKVLEQIGVPRPKSLVKLNPDMFRKIYAFLL